MIEQPGTDHRVVGAQFRALQGQQRILIVAPRQQRPVAPSHAAEQKKLTHVMKQTGQIGLFEVGALEPDGQGTRKFGHLKRMTPEARQVVTRIAHRSRKDSLDGETGRHGADQTRTQRNEALIEALQLATTTQGNGVGRDQHMGAERRILPDHGRQLIHGGAIILRHAQEPQ